MTFAEALREALRLLRAQPLRSALTLFGLIWGTAAVIFLVSWGSGVKTMMEASFARVGKNLIFVFPGKVKEDFSPAVDRRYLWFTLEDIELLRRRAHLPALVAGETSRSVPISLRARSSNGQARGIEPESMLIRGAPLAAGRGITRSDVRLRRRVVVLGDTQRARVQAHVGDWVRLDGTPFQVVGLLGRVGMQLSRDGPLIDEQVWVPISTHQLLWHNPWVTDDVVQTLLIQMRDRRLLRDTKAEVRGILAAQLGVPADDDEALVMFSPQELLATIPLDQQNGLYILIGGTTLVIGGIGVLTLMLDAVRERRREIGVRLAVGARQRDVLLQLFLESVVLVVIGGASGVAVGVGGALFLASDRFRSWIPSADLADLVPIPELTFGVIVLAVSVMSAVAVLAGIVPAWRAARVDPALTLRAD